MRFILALILTLTIGGIVSLHDVDKTNSNRITPMLNSADDVQQRMAQGTNGVQNTNDLEEVDGLQFRERQIVAVQDGENKAAFGFYGDANKFGFKVAEDGVDVLTATNSQLIFNSEQNIFKIVATGQVTVNKPAGTSYAQGSDTHSLGYVPAALVFTGSANATIRRPVPYADFSGGNGYVIRGVSYYVDDTQIVVDVDTPNSGVPASEYGDELNLTYTYYLLQETAN